MGGKADPIRSPKMEPDTRISLPPGKIIAGQSMAIVNDPHLMRRVARPAPENQIGIDGGGPGGEAWYDDAGVAGGDEAVGQDPTRRRLAPGGEFFPGAGKVRWFYAKGAAIGGLGEIDDILAINVIGADGHRL